MAEFAANNNESASNKLYPFFATKGFHFRISFDIIDFSDTNTCERIFKQKALDIFGNINTIWEYFPKTIASAQESQSKQADKYCKDVSYAVGNKVVLCT